MTGRRARAPGPVRPVAYGAVSESLNWFVVVPLQRTGDVEAPDPPPA